MNVPLRHLPDRLGELEGSPPVIVYCHDTLSDMSPRSAWRLETVGVALDRLAAGYGPVVAVNAAGVVLGTPHREQMRPAGPGTPVGDLLRFGISTVRPSEEVPDLAHRMLDAQLTRIVVTRADGTLVGLFFAPTQASTSTPTERHGEHRAEGSDR